MFDVKVAGADELSRKIAAMPEAIRTALNQKRVELAQGLLDKIAAKLSGQVLNAGGGALRDSIAAGFDDDLSARIYSAGDVKYAAAQEYGFDGEESVGAHSCEIREAFGKAISPKTIFVAAFSRHMHLPERSYMRASLDEMQDDISQGFRKAIEEVMSS
jgi:hypothetical protein